ncbi:hypothetical protein [Streptomyces bobili]|uniref:VMAP-C domain-containing protein n=1 Tax=Streptomyces bobili TaxID=67280 RepID=UPI003CC61915
MLDLPVDRWSVSSSRSNDTTGAGPVGVLRPVVVRGLERPTDLTRRGRRRRSCGVRGGATRSDQTTDLRPVPPDSPNA